MLSRIGIVVLCSLIVCTSVQAQSAVEYGLSRSIRIAAPGFSPYKGVEGSPYVPNDSAQNGWLMYNTKRVPARLRYNAYTGELEYIEGNRVLTPTNGVMEFAILEPDTMYFHRGFPATETRTPDSFYQVLFNGRKAKLLRYVFADIKTNTEQMNNDFGKKTFQKREEYYVWVARVQPPAENYFEKLSDGDMKPIFVSKKSLLSVFPQYAERIERYVANQKLKLKSWSELASVLKYLESQ
ncbi:hypothetical protein [Spirosoma sp. KNUC1025]|uniref:hypothetical protein n=1 Tax=Spirosoma sp. KNUC1025 TaxID=2894082 RepID=UPI003870E909|nr:hypothetical protein LN737_12760 [Spirosoma sp. KNUC1025]